jgi:Flp pilus assembly protein TadG
MISPRQTTSRRRQKRHQRRGATTLELAITFGLFLVVTLGTFDLGIGVFRHHVVAQAARQGARRAIVHGTQATALGSWGPDTVETLATNAGYHGIVDGAEDGISEMLVGCDLSRTNIRIEWLANRNEFEDLVRVTVSTPYQPILLFMFGAAELNLTASSTMPIAH